MLEGLEDRMLMYAATGDHFAFGSRITFSFMPDGTNIGGVPSNLISTMDSRFGAGQWESAFQAAAGEWEEYANVNFVQVYDDGAPLNEGAYQQGSPEFGDIRIGGFTMPNGSLAFTLLPPPNNGGSDSGDMFFNTTAAWQINQTNYDLETVAYHEFGHALGLGHSTDSNAAMYPYYTVAKQTPDNDDIAGIQSIWGPRQEDGLNQGWNNLHSNQAANITPFMTANNQISLPGLDVASNYESYWFKVTTPANASPNLSVAVQSTNLSELSPEVQLYNANLQGLLMAYAPTNAYGATVGVTYTSATPNTTYYIHVFPTNTGPTSTGAYALLVNMGSAAIPLANPPATLVAAQADQGGGGLFQGSGGLSSGQGVGLGAGTKGGGAPGGGIAVASPVVDPPDILQLPLYSVRGDYLMDTPAPIAIPAPTVQVNVNHPHGPSKPTTQTAGGPASAGWATASSTAGGFLVANPAGGPSVAGQSSRPPSVSPSVAGLVNAGGGSGRYWTATRGQASPASMDPSLI